MDNCMSDVTKDMVNLSLIALHSVAKGEVEAHPSSVSSSSPTIPLEKLNHQITPIPLISNHDLVLVNISSTEFFNLLHSINSLIDKLKIMALTQEYF